MCEPTDDDVWRALIHKIGAERRPIFVAASVGEFVGACAQGGERIVFLWHQSANAHTLPAFLSGIGKCYGNESKFGVVAAFRLRRWRARSAHVCTWHSAARALAFGASSEARHSKIAPR